jgi:hypothetical protein
MTNSSSSHVSKLLPHHRHTNPAHSTALSNSMPRLHCPLMKFHMYSAKEINPPVKNDWNTVYDLSKMTAAGETQWQSLLSYMTTIQVINVVIKPWNSTSDQGVVVFQLYYRLRDVLVERRDQQTSYIIPATKTTLRWKVVANVDAFQSYISCGGKSSCLIND